MGTKRAKRKNPAKWTDAFIKSLRHEAKPYKLAEDAPRGAGRLVVRVQPNGTKEFFYRYRGRAGELDKTLALGRYDPAGRNGKTLAGIRDELRDRRETQRQTGDVKEHRRQAREREDTARRRGSLEQLLLAYAARLKAEGKPSHREALGIFHRNIIRPFPALAARKAADVSGDDVRLILAKMVKAGITRGVNKTRAYLGAAFSYGGEADHDPRTVAADGVLFGIKANPVSLVPVISEYERVLDRVLTDDELRLYWNGLDALPAVQAATLRFNLALACQRPTQLLRADWTAFDFTMGTLLLRDPKGRGASRDHLLPLTGLALEQLKPLRQMNGKEALPFSTNGKRRLSVDTLTGAVAEVSAELEKQKVPAFQQRDLRRTAETMLQRMGIDKEVRAHLLSHGRSQGVQGKHYERYDFLKEKRAALEKWARHLERIISGKAAKVVAIKGAA